MVADDSFSCFVDFGFGGQVCREKNDNNLYLHVDYFGKI